MTSEVTTELLLKGNQAQFSDVENRLHQCPGIQSMQSTSHVGNEWSLLVTGTVDLHTLLATVGPAQPELGFDVRVVSQGAALPVAVGTVSGNKRTNDAMNGVSTNVVAGAGRPFASAVAQFTEPPVLGLVRLTEVAPSRTVVDVDLNILGENGSGEQPPQQPTGGASCCAITSACEAGSVLSHTLALHRSGDLSAGFQSIGNRFCFGDGQRVDGSLLHGSLGQFARSNAEVVGRTEHSFLAVGDVIGRSLCVYGDADTPLHLANRPLACAVIARSAGVLENPKRLCTCDGTTIWEKPTV